MSGGTPPVDENGNAPVGAHGRAPLPANYPIFILGTENALDLYLLLVLCVLCASAVNIAFDFAPALPTEQDMVVHSVHSVYSGATAGRVPLLSYQVRAA